MNQDLDLTGIVHVLQYREDKLLRDLTFKNKILWWGKRAVLNQFFGGVSTFSGFYVGLLKTAVTFTADEPTIASLIADEFSNYAPGARPQITFEAAADDGSTYFYVQNAPANYCVFTIGSAETNRVLNGIFVAPLASGTPATMWCTAAFGNNDATPAPVTVNTGDILRIQYTVRIPRS
jgi:hypothetical protein